MKQQQLASMMIPNVQQRLSSSAILLNPSPTSPTSSSSLEQHQPISLSTLVNHSTITTTTSCCGHQHPHQATIGLYHDDSTTTTTKTTYEEHAIDCLESKVEVVWRYLATAMISILGWICYLSTIMIGENFVNFLSIEDESSTSSKLFGYSLFNTNQSNTKQDKVDKVANENRRKSSLLSKICFNEKSPLVDIDTIIEELAHDLAEVIHHSLQHSNKESSTQQTERSQELILSSITNKEVETIPLLKTDDLHKDFSDSLEIVQLREQLNSFVFPFFTPSSL